MGWSGGTEVFDVACMQMVEGEFEFDTEVIISVLGPILDVLEDKDWDNVCESEYFLHPIIRQVIESRHPAYYEDEDYDEE